MSAAARWLLMKEPTPPRPQLGFPSLSASSTRPSWPADSSASEPPHWLPARGAWDSAKAALQPSFRNL
eukprot:1722839-Lingulodinium_polyedra.AAC.1